MAVDEQAKARDELEAIQPTAEPREWTLGHGEVSRTYVQKPLGLMSKLRFFSLLGETIRKVTIVGGEGTLTDIIQGQQLGQRGRDLLSGDMADAESFLTLASSFVIYVPDFLEEAYCIILKVPLEQRPWAKLMMDADPDEGGLSDEDGFAIINTFVAQNWDALRDFFGVHLRSVWTMIQAQQTEEEKTEEVAAAA